jgi:hypothetical protein
MNEITQPINIQDQQQAMNALLVELKRSPDLLQSTYPAYSTILEETLEHYLKQMTGVSASPSMESLVTQLNDRLYDELFCRLFEVLRQAPENSLEWKLAMHELLHQLQPLVKRHSHPDYQEALHRTWDWFISRYREFNPCSDAVKQSLVKWVNGYLYWRTRDLRSGQTVSISLDEPIDREAGATRLDRISDTAWQAPTLDGIDQLIAQQQAQATKRVGEQLAQYINEDPTGELKRCHPRKYPACHAQYLAQMRLLEEPALKFEAIAATLNLTKAIVHNHWYDRCLPLLRKIAIRFGYQSE